MGDFNSQKNRVVWVDIPVADLERACTFYREVLAIGVSQEQFGDMKFAVLDHEDGNGGCLVPMPENVGQKPGILIYLNVDGRIQEAVSKVESHGGSVEQPIHSIGPHGFRAIIRDSEGNYIALHSNSDA
ncbi:MAG: VOC family protein [Planctomycetaceae bacterium]